MHSTLPVWLITDPISSRVVASQNETNDPEEAAMNAPLLDSVMRLSLSLWMDH